MWMCATMCSEWVELCGARVDVHRAVRVNRFGVNHMFYFSSNKFFFMLYNLFPCKIKMSFKEADMVLAPDDSLMHYTFFLPQEI